MKTLQLPNWEAFKNEVATERAQTLQGQLLFRGQRSASWLLETTLQRRSSKQFTPMQYYHKVYKIKQKVADLSNQIHKQWNLPPDYPKLHSDEYNEYIEYLVYLRHYGFPSPLLDWSTKEDVAAFFAFRKAQAASCMVAIFLYKFLTGPMFYHPNEPPPFPLKCNVISVSRHRNQDTKYTVCLNENNQFCSCEYFFQTNQTPQDPLIKYLIPASERTKVLKELHANGKTAHFFLQSDEGLVEDLAFEEIDLDP